MRTVFTLTGGNGVLAGCGYGGHGQQAHVVDGGFDFAGGGGHHRIAVDAGVGGHEGAGQAVVAALGCPEAAGLVQRGVGDHHYQGGVGQGVGGVGEAVGGGDAGAG